MTSIALDGPSLPSTLRLRTQADAADAMSNARSARSREAAASSSRTSHLWDQFPRHPKPVSRPGRGRSVFAGISLNADVGLDPGPRLPKLARSNRLTTISAVDTANKILAEAAVAGTQAEGVNNGDITRARGQAAVTCIGGAPQRARPTSERGRYPIRPASLSRCMLAKRSRSQIRRHSSGPRRRLALSSVSPYLRTRPLRQKRAAR